jgi:hypothetical protein
MRSRTLSGTLVVTLVLAIAIPSTTSAQGYFYVRDSFVAITNALLETHNPDVGTVGSWYRLLGQGLKIVNNALRPVANNTDELYGNNTSAGQVEYGVGVSVLFTTKQADPNCLTGFACTDHYGLLWARGDVTSLNGYFARVTASGQVVILMNNKGNTTLLASTTIKVPPFNIAHPMVFAIRNSMKEVYWDGVMVLSTTDNTLTGSSSALLKNGLGARSTVAGGTVLDDFFVSPFPSLTGVSPTSGPPGGGQIMTVTGANVNGCYARVAGTVAQGISGTVNNEVFYSPPHAAGTVTVDCATAYTFGVKIALYAPTLPNAYTYTPSLQASRPNIFPAAGDTTDASGNEIFRTTLQLYNPSDIITMGEVVLHPSGAPFTSSDPGSYFMINPRSTTFLPDITAAIFQDDFGALDLTTWQGPSPVAAMRMVQGDASNTVGADVEEVFASVGIGEGSSGVLLTPPDPSASAFNVNIRTFTQDTTLQFTFQDSSGNLLGTAAQDFPANTFTQLPAEQVFRGTALGGLGALLNGGASITIAPQSGFAMVYGATTDNLSGDLDLQRAAVLSSDPPVPLIVPVAVSQGNVHTSVQLYNPTSAPITLNFSSLSVPRSRFSRPMVSDVLVQNPGPIVLQPGVSRFIPDIMQFFGWAGTTSIGITVDTGSPVMLFRTYTNGLQGGTVGAFIGAVDPTTTSLNSGNTATLMAPPMAAGSTMNLAVRTFDTASLQLALNDSTGNLKKQVTLTYPRGSLRVSTPASIFGVPLADGDSISIAVQSGSAIVASVTTDNNSGDISYHLATAQ